MSRKKRPWTDAELTAMDEHDNKLARARYLRDKLREEMERRFPGLLDLVSQLHDADAEVTALENTNANPRR